MNTPTRSRADGAAQWLADIEGAARGGDWTRAAAWADRAIALGIEHARIFHIRAAARERTGDLAGVIADLERAHALAPADVGIANAWAVALTRMDRWREAVAILGPIVDARPDSAVSWFNLGEARRAEGVIPDAEAAYRRVMALEPAHADAVARLAVLANHRGAPAEAMALAERALAIDPAHADARRARIEALIAEKAYETAEREARAWLGAPGLGPSARTHALGLLGDALEELRRFPEAFQAFSASKAAFADANRRQFARLETYPLALTLAGVREEFQSIAPEAWRGAEPPATGDGPPTHVFLMGFMRSGTTLLEQALARHPDAVSVEELETLAGSGGALIGEPGGLRRIAAFSEGEIAAARLSYWRAVRDAGIEPGGKVLIDKLPFNGIKLPLIAKLFPEAKVIFAIRDPRDVVLSCFQKRLAANGFSYEMRTLDGAARFYAAYMELVGAYRGRLAVPILDHRHEGLIADVGGSIREVCDFAGLDFRPELVAFERSARAGRVMSQSSRQLGEGLTARGVGRWRSYADELAPVLPVLAPWAASFGYPKA